MLLAFAMGEATVSCLVSEWILRFVIFIMVRLLGLLIFTITTIGCSNWQFRRSMMAILIYFFFGRRYSVLLIEVLTVSLALLAWQPVIFKSLNQYSWYNLILLIIIRFLKVLKWLIWYIYISSGMQILNSFLDLIYFSIVNIIRLEIIIWSIACGILYLIK